ncbi:ACP phosphodiesterase [Lutibacter sp. B1]|uniref:acyl carrier protein phosphodiesterase n=1 Tax=Lutibacter sp. B1 TaxID=2725996 RepID=UPI0014578D9E|nr:ACP phosphodiesterase [Lutibacter sp. B1]NLP56642.1 DUF479 domain-containing protein [Lutibacter sp. B1]
MNYLAHLYLSKNNKNILIGNFISDAVKGKNYQHYPKEIQQGIILHRNIDTFTDTHPIVRKSKHRLHERYKHYDGIIIDIFYDYFLAKNWNDYSEIPLNVYASNIYQLLKNESTVFPPKMQQILQYMIQYNWLETYQSKKGIEKVLQGMNKRTEGKSLMNLAIEDLQKYHDELEADFKTFFKDLINFTNEKTKLLLEI